MAHNCYVSKEDIEYGMSDVVDAVDSMTNHNDMLAGKMMMTQSNGMNDDKDDDEDWTMDDSHTIKSKSAGCQETKKCSLCFKIYPANELEDGHKKLGPASRSPLSKVLVMSLQMSLRLPGKSWEICEDCSDTLEEADSKQQEFNEIKKEMVEMKKRLYEIIKPRLRSMKVRARTQPMVKSPLNLNVKMAGPAPKNDTDEKHKPPPPPPSILVRGLTTEEGREKMPCPLCQKIVTKRTLRLHVPRLHTKDTPLICIKCVRKIPNEKQFADHMLTYHTEDKLEDLAYSCDIEKAITKRLGKRPSVKTKVTCPVCKATISSVSLKDHMNIHEQKYIHKCRHCAEMFITRSHRKLHMRRIHGIQEPRRVLSCQYCQKTFLARSGLSQHISRVHERKNDVDERNKAFKCEFCDKMFKLKYELKQHRRKHTDERPYVCKICNQSFRRTASCRKHIQRVHKIDIKELRLNDPFQSNLLPIMKVQSNTTITTQIMQPQQLPPQPPQQQQQQQPQQHIQLQPQHKPQHPQQVAPQPQPQLQAHHTLQLQQHAPQHLQPQHHPMQHHHHHGLGLPVTTHLPLPPHMMHNPYM